MTVQLLNYFPVLVLAACAVLLLPQKRAPWLRYIVGGACALAALLLTLKNLTANV